MEVLIPILGIVMGCSIAIVAIIAKTVLKMQTLKIKKGTGDDKEIRKQLGYIMSENEELKERVQNLEYLMSSANEQQDRMPIRETEKIRNFK